MSALLHVLCAGAAEGLVGQLRPRFESGGEATLQVSFGAVGALREAFAAGAPCDVIVVTEAMVQGLQQAGEATAVAAAIGSVQTGVAVRNDDALPDVSSAEALKQALLAAPAVYFPDPERSTAGIHFASVLARLGVQQQLAPRLRTFANGAAAMRALAASGEAGALGCTQVTEIVRTPGLRLLGPLPAGLGLATLYSAVATTRAADATLAARFVELLTGASSAEQRRECGFEPAPSR